MDSKEIIWAQSYLKDNNLDSFSSVEELKNGVIIIELLQLISGKKIAKYYKSPKNRFHSIENANIAITFMRENGLLLNSPWSPQDLSDGNEKGIFSIIYRLYLFAYSKPYAGKSGKSRHYRHSSLDFYSTSSVSRDNIADIVSGGEQEEDILGLTDDSTTDTDTDYHDNVKKSISHSSISSIDRDQSSEESSGAAINNNHSNHHNKPPSFVEAKWKKNGAPTLSGAFIGSRRSSWNISRETSDENFEKLSSASASSLPSTTTTTPEATSPLSGSTSSLPSVASQAWFKVKVDEQKKDVPKRKVPHLVKISPVDLDRYNNNSQEYEATYIQCQRYIRGWLARKSLKQRKKFNNHRNRCFNEIITSEESYVQCVEMIVKVFYQQILWNSKVSPTPYLTPENIHTIFSTINQIYSFNTELLKQLKEVASKWSPTQKLGDIFHSMAPYLKLYKTYCLNYDAAIECLQKAKKNETFKLFIKACLDHPENKMKQSLESLLITVVQRIPRYILLIQDLLSHTWSDHLDYENLKSALKMVQSVAIEVNASIKMAESQSKVLEIQKSLVGWDESYGELVHPARLFIKQSTILNCKLDTRFSKDLDTMVYFLFNDSILITNNKDSSRYQVKYFFEFSETRIKDIEDSLVLKNSFQLISSKSTAFLAFETIAEKKNLIQHIEQKQQKSKNRQTLLISSSFHESNDNISLSSSINNSNNSLGNSVNNSSGNNSQQQGFTHYNVTISKYESKKEAGKKEFTIYYINIINESSGEKFDISKRYSDFDHLNKKLKKKFPDVQLKELPKKHFMNSLGSNTVESRRLMLELYLQHLFQIESIQKSPVLWSFIKSETPQFTTEATFDDLSQFIKNKQSTSTAAVAAGTRSTSSNNLKNDDSLEKDEQPQPPQQQEEEQINQQESSSTNDNDTNSNNNN
ncbi:hypothetical protein CYY_003443 [Polysphondylium violaceum]|uniref:Pleckstrin domain-containing protein n=1 Tax=Polysphondylium violaceum TaxID=133409 RepID=A0A8J4PZA7_9MYCE|nr:hypothetical protein CYY_003443 [Polysphondylium violaceum]